MDKQDLMESLKNLKADLTALKGKCATINGKQVHTRSVLDGLERLAITWFETIEPYLRDIVLLDEDTLSQYSENFGTMLRQSGRNPAKTSVLGTLASILRSYHQDIVVTVLKHQEAANRFPKLDDLLSHVEGLEREYLSEAVDCANLGKFRASIILAWCAAVGRLHRYIEKEGFSKLNQASKQMCAIKTGRYKRFSSAYDIQNLSDLRMTVFDKQLLWILEYMGAIDGNQHERLGICLTIRDTCAHPGEATISEENLLSFFSDIDTMIISNKKFQVPLVAP